MRTLVITLAVFLALCVAMTLNYFYINDRTEVLVNLTESLEVNGDAAEKLDEISRIWKESEPIFSLSVSFREIDYLGETLLALRCAHENRDEVEFERYKTLLVDALEGVSRLEQFSIINIF